MQTVRASERYRRALAATAELLSKLRLESMFVGGVARAAWLGGRLERDSLEVLVLMNEQQKNQVATMASNRGFRLEKEEVEQSEELDLIPLHFVDPEGDVRVFVLLASNALYGRMFAQRTPTVVEGVDINVASAEDLAFLLAMAEDDDSKRDNEMLMLTPGFDRKGYNERLKSIGLPALMVAE